MSRETTEQPERAHGHRTEEQQADTTVVHIRCGNCKTAVTNYFGCVICYGCVDYVACCDDCWIRSWDAHRQSCLGVLTGQYVGDCIACDEQLPDDSVGAAHGHGSRGYSYRGSRPHGDRGFSISRSKAAEMLRNPHRGVPLTPAQRGLFGWLASGKRH
jgi:hypothetical protein